MDPNVLAILGVLAGGGLIGVFLRYRSQNRVDDAESTSTLATAAASIYKDSMDALQARVEDMASQMADLRDRARSAEAAAAEAAAEAARFRTGQAEVQAELARVIAEAGVQRHALQNEITARDVRISNLERELAAVREELATLRARLGESERRSRPRRSGDKPPE